MSHSLGVAIESLVAILLMLTIGYCMLLNKRLKRLKADEHSLKATIAELITATEIAERAIGGLKHTVRDVNENLGTQLTAATEMSAQLKKQLGECDNVVRRLSKIAIAARPAATARRTARPRTGACAAPSLERQGGRGSRTGFLRPQKGQRACCMKPFRNIRVLPVVLVAVFGLAVLKIAGLVLDGGYVFDYRPDVDQAVLGAGDLQLSGPQLRRCVRHHRLGREGKRETEEEEAKPEVAKAESHGAARAAPRRCRLPNAPSSNGYRRGVRNSRRGRARSIFARAC